MILFEELPPKQDGAYMLPSDDHRYRHITRILRLKPGDACSVGIVNGPSGKAVITTLKREYLSFTWDREEECQELHPLVLMVGHIRPICMKRVLRDASSLGIMEIWITGTDLGERSYREATIWSTGNWRTYLIDGAQQAASTAVSEVKFFARVDEAVAACGEYGDAWNRVVLDVGGVFPALDQVSLPHPRSVLAIGSERGWSERERKLLSEWGWQRARFGNRILRTETACAAASALVLSRMGKL